MFFRQIIDPLLSQHAFLIGCESSREAILFEPERDIDRYLNLASKNGYEIIAAAETHIHADYLSGLRQFAERGIRVYASDEGDSDWKYNWLNNSSYQYGLLKHGDKFRVGNISFKVLHTPGHTPEHISFVVADSKTGIGKENGVLTGDFVFVGDVGRPDLLETAAGIEGSAQTAARQLYESLQHFKQLHPDLMIWPSHGAGSACGKALGAAPMSTVGEELKYNRSLAAALNVEEFVDYILTGQPEPPYYFARMKKENKEGPAVLKELPKPGNVPPREIERLVSQKNTIVLDGRDWEDFRQGHISGTLFAPLDKYFMMVAGSYIRPGTEIALIADEETVGPTVTALIRIGHDNITAYTTPYQFTEHFQKDGKLDSIPEISVSELKEMQSKFDGHLLDVRNASELMETGQIGAAQNIAFTRLLLQHHEIPKDEKIYVYCRSGNRSEYASSFLKNSGFRVIHVAGGIVAWQGVGGAVVPFEAGVRQQFKFKKHHSEKSD